MGQIVLGNEKRRSQIEQAVERQNAKPWILSDRVREITGNISVAHAAALPLSSASCRRGGAKAVRMVPLLVHARAGRIVGLIRRKLQLAVEIIVERRYKSSFDSGIGWIVTWCFARCIDVGTLEARVIASENGALVAEQFLTKTSRTDPEVGFLDVLHAKSGITRKPGGRCVHLCLRQIVSHCQRFRVRTARVGAHFVQKRFFVLGLMWNL